MQFWRVIECKPMNFQWHERISDYTNFVAVLLSFFPVYFVHSTIWIQIYLFNFPILYFVNPHGITYAGRQPFTICSYYHMSFRHFQTMYTFSHNNFQRILHTYASQNNHLFHLNSSPCSLPDFAPSSYKEIHFKHSFRSVTVLADC